MLLLILAKKPEKHCYQIEIGCDGADLAAVKFNGQKHLTRQAWVVKNTKIVQVSSSELGAIKCEDSSGI